MPRRPRSTLFPYTTLFRSRSGRLRAHGLARSEVLVYDLAALIYEARRDTALADTLATLEEETRQGSARAVSDRKSTRLNSSHVSISYAVFCLKKKNTAISV